MRNSQIFRTFDFVESTLARKISNIYLVFCSLICTFDFVESTLARKISNIYLVFCSLICTFAPDLRKFRESRLRLSRIQASLILHSTCTRFTLEQ